MLADDVNIFGVVFNETDTMLLQEDLNCPVGVCKCI